MADEANELREPTERLRRPHRRELPEDPERRAARRLSSMRIIVSVVGAVAGFSFVVGVAIGAARPRIERYIERKAAAAVAEHAAQPGHSEELKFHRAMEARQARLELQNWDMHWWLGKLAERAHVDPPPPPPPAVEPTVVP